MELTLAEIKSKTFLILQHFQCFCQKNNIQFYLSNGTLLGAIKYGGFIPWDDDIDVFVPRKDYNRLIEIYKDNDKYKLFSRERNIKFRFTFAKLCDMSIVKEENNIDNGVQLGLDIDIFPLDFCSEHILRPAVQQKIKVYQKGCILSKFVSAKGYPLFKRIIINWCRLMGYDFFYNRFLKIIMTERKMGDDFCGCLMWLIYGKREILPASVFSSTIEVEFEEKKFPAPIGYDKYLRNLYGEYEKDPPMEKQKTHHSYKAYSK